MSKSPSIEPEVARRLEALNKQVATTAEDIVFRTFPQKILQLNEIIESTQDASSTFHQSHLYKTTDTTVYPPPSPLDTKKRKRSEDDLDGIHPMRNDLSDARFPSLVLANQHVKQAQEKVRKECEDLIELCDKVKLWISLTMPKIEDGDNFGVQIQEEVLSELHRSQESGYNLRDETRTNHLNRGKICSKLIKYPNIEDYALALREHDAKQLYMARQHLVDIKNIYSVLTDVIHKNIQKIRAPRGNNRAGLY
ncbi:proteasome activator pa28 REG alpha/beta subunit [Gautieria morchelliformis]|nr:proteasome activator pa28 REG alpha/beta subunit [Gautieria morchelliformis]